MVRDTFRHNDLTAVKIPRTGIRNTAGTVLLVLAVVSGIASADPWVGGGAMTATVILVGGGIALKSKERIHLGNSWTLSTTRAIVPGNLISVKMKNGEVFKAMLVTKVTSKKIIGELSGVDADGQKIRHDKSVLIKDIVECARTIN